MTPYKGRKIINKKSWRFGEQMWFIGRLRLRYMFSKLPGDLHRENRGDI